GHSQLKTGHPVRSAIHKQLNGRLVLRWVTTWESLLLYVLRLLFYSNTHIESIYLCSHQLFVTLGSLNCSSPWLRPIMIFASSRIVKIEVVPPSLTAGLKTINLKVNGNFSQLLLPFPSLVRRHQHIGSPTDASSITVYRHAVQPYKVASPQIFSSGGRSSVLTYMMHYHTQAAQAASLHEVPWYRRCYWLVDLPD
ncbi:hypothetical protein KCV07_g1, partial [Aureobasidium melanogenum]